jgi:hypothetical protein
MPRTTLPARTFEQIFEQAKAVGPENVMVNDAETGIVLAGGGKPVSAGTIANRRWRGDFTAPCQRGADRQVEYRLSDVLAERDRKIKRSA